MLIDTLDTAVSVTFNCNHGYKVMQFILVLSTQIHTIAHSLYKGHLGHVACLEEIKNNSFIYTGTVNRS